MNKTQRAALAVKYLFDCDTQIVTVKQFRNLPDDVWFRFGSTLDDYTVQKKGNRLVGTNYKITKEGLITSPIEMEFSEDLLYILYVDALKTASVRRKILGIPEHPLSNFYEG